MAHLPTIGVRVHGGMTPQACIEIGEATERNGYSALWFAENPFERGVLPAVTGAALATKRIRIGIGVFNPYNRHPTLMAMEMGALDELSGGRAVLGIGSGIGSRIVQMGLSYDKPLAAVRDAVNIVRAMMNGEEVNYSGKVFTAAGAKLGFKPPRPDMPIYVAAMGDQALRVAGQVGDGVMVSNMCPPDYTERAMGLIAEGADKVGRETPETIVQYVLCAADKDREQARASVKITIGAMLVAYWGLGASLPALRSALRRGLDVSEDEFEATVEKLKQGAKATDVLDDRYVDAYAVAGNADDCLAGAMRFADKGVTDLVFTFVGERPVDDMTYLRDVMEQAP